MRCDLRFFFVSPLFSPTMSAFQICHQLSTLCCGHPATVTCLYMYQEQIKKLPIDIELDESARDVYNALRAARTYEDILSIVQNSVLTVRTLLVLKQVETMLARIFRQQDIGSIIEKYSVANLISDISAITTESNIPVPSLIDITSHALDSYTM